MQREGSQQSRAESATDVEQEYWARIDAMSPTERIARSMAMLKWHREMLARQIVATEGEMSQERLRWKVARRMYAAEPAVVAMIDQVLNDLCD